MNLDNKFINQALQFEQQKLIDIFYKGYKETYSEEKIQSIIKQIKTIEKFSSNKTRYFVLFSHKEFLPIYISANIINFGYTPKEILKFSLYDGFKAVHWKQITVGVKGIRWAQKYTKLIDDYPLIGDEVIFCGIKFRSKFGQYRSFLLKIKYLTFVENRQPLYSFIEAEDITDLYKVNFYWALFTNTSKQKEISRVYFSSGTKKEYSSLLSPRESEILQLILADKKSQEISKKLNISLETVKKHRKNMIARIGAKDMTALIQILKLSNVL